MCNYNNKDMCSASLIIIIRICANICQPTYLEANRLGLVRCGAVWCSVVQCGAVWCSVVQCGVVWCSVVQ